MFNLAQVVIDAFIEWLQERYVIDNQRSDCPTVGRFEIQGAIGTAQYRAGNVLTYFLCNDFDFARSVHYRLLRSVATYLAKSSAV